MRQPQKEPLELLLGIFLQLFLTGFGAYVFSPVPPSRCMYPKVLQTPSGSIHACTCAQVFRLIPLQTLAILHGSPAHCCPKTAVYAPNTSLCTRNHTFFNFPVYVSGYFIKASSVSILFLLIAVTDNVLNNFSSFPPQPVQGKIGCSGNIDILLFEFNKEILLWIDIYRT